MTSALSAGPTDTSVPERGYLLVLAITECELPSLSTALDFARFECALSRVCKWRRSRSQKTDGKTVRMNRNQSVPH